SSPPRSGRGSSSRDSATSRSRSFPRSSRTSSSPPTPASCSRSGRSGRRRRKRKNNMGEEGKEKIDYFGPEIILAFTAAGISDLIFMIGLGTIVLPIIGLPIFAFFYAIHLFGGTLAFIAAFGKLQHIVPKLVFALFVFLPLPLLPLGMALAIVMQNK